MISAARGPLLLIVLIALLLATLWFWARTSLPAQQGSMSLPGLARPVVIDRDEFGVPSIEAESQEDAYYALGFVHAQDRLWQMEYRRLRATGRLSELLGEEALAGDLLVRTLGLRQAAERDLLMLSARTRGAVQAYSDGVNAFLERRSGALPPEFLLLGHAPEAWSPADVAAVQKLQAWEQTRAASDEIFLARLAGRLSEDEFESLVAVPLTQEDLEGVEATLPVDEDLESVEGSQASRRPLSPPLPAEAYDELPLSALQALLARPEQSIPGSRAWAVAGAQTVNGYPLLGVERHGPLAAPAPWYLVHLRAPGLDVSGETLPGMPSIFAGRSSSMAWAVVPGDLDSQDLYLERLETGAESGHPGEGEVRYLTPEGWRELETRQERVRVRGADEVNLLVRETRHGPVISDLVDSGASGYAVALRWTALQEGDRTLQGALDLARARSHRELRAALANLHENGGRVLYADSEGQIGWQVTARLPQRDAWTGRLPVPGWEERFDWGSWLPAARLAGELDPGAGRIVLSRHQAEPAAELLDTLESHTVQSFARLMQRQHQPLARLFLPLLRATEPRNQQARRAHAQLLGWQGETASLSAAPVIFSAWYPEFVRSLLADELGEQLAAGAGQHPEVLLQALSNGEWCDDRRTSTSEDCGEVSSRAFSEAVALLSERYGPEPRKWPRGESFASDYRHPVFDETLLGPLFRVATVGDAETRNDLALLTGPTYRAVFELVPADRPEGGAEVESGVASEDASGHLIPTGQSGNPFSSHYRDLAARWAEVELIPAGSLAVGETEDGSRLVLEPR